MARRLSVVQGIASHPMQICHVMREENQNLQKDSCAWLRREPRLRHTQLSELRPPWRHPLPCRLLQQPLPKPLCQHARSATSNTSTAIVATALVALWAGPLPFSGCRVCACLLQSRVPVSSAHWKYARVCVHKSPSTSLAGPNGMQQSRSFKEAALNDPFADLGPVAKPQTAQTTPPLREVSPTQQRINLGEPRVPHMHHSCGVRPAPLSLQVPRRIYKAWSAGCCRSSGQALPAWEAEQPHSHLCPEIRNGRQLGTCAGAAPPRTWLATDVLPVALLIQSRRAAAALWSAAATVAAAGPAPGPAAAGAPTGGSRYTLNPTLTSARRNFLPAANLPGWPRACSGTVKMWRRNSVITVKSLDAHTPAQLASELLLERVKTVVCVSNREPHSSPRPAQQAPQQAGQNGWGTQQGFASFPPPGAAPSPITPPGGGAGPRW